jgi:peptidylprolyl isomerase
MKKILALAVLVPCSVLIADTKKQELAPMAVEKVVTKGAQIKVHYTGTLTDGTKFDSSRDRGTPLAFQAGAGQMIPGFDAGVLGMKVGEKKIIKIAAKDAYGECDTRLIINVTRAQFPEGKLPSIGDRFQAVEQNSNRVRIAKVTAINGDTITLDANHELAGKDLTFDIEVVEIS